MKNANIVSIAYSHLSPTATISDLSFWVPCSLPSFTNDYTAAMSFITVLCSDFGNRLDKDAEHKLKSFDSFAENSKLHTMK
jgi:DNA-binding MurR/RpiR family transcriptional regulator